MPYAAGLYFEEHGAGEGTAVILSSGLGGSANYWAPNLPALAADRRVIAYDHRGTGRSDRTLPDAVSVADFADDILTVMDAAGMERASIIGHAAGGVAALVLALQVPERIDRLVIVNGWASPDPHFLRCFEARLALLRNSGIEAFIRAQPIFLYPANWISEHSTQLDSEAVVQLDHFPGIEATEKRIAALAAFDITARLGDISVPVMLIAAADDMLVPSNASVRLAAGLPNAVIATMAYGGHACNVTDPDGFDTLVREFLGS